MLETVMDGSYELIMLGDLNLQSHDSKVKYMCELYCLDQLISEPTRVTNKTSSCIDHIYTSMPDEHRKSGVIKKTCSDHYIIQLWP